MTTFNSEEITLSSANVSWGVYHKLYQLLLTFPYIFLLIDFSFYFPMR